uniref:Acyltransferase 3 domain-containing protein n=1 Tax=Octactis speculum TaxID=3111310 RepID=A0A7S2GPP5_9STRA|mmetsp:Transcript_52369/g.71487  ORF Transcript_52369/g.71487 Transcript_52369/m.71487 type:complete len:532 (+) Transcript_52369:68-1663(+)|eukprot:CAMPEP_0185754082 /NCGR_PEP_ID=MMETSP1174-20130828/12740_1 /TAXON_ID=35687 /ORGANISM="Dictyocha speculum, Strain CCMP1381" /LENGTH=531 /DNA_ID=CAMNT_0028432153 /DNA_START=20 /DNA_END=1615 /DNA_ORIENTATION=-
MESVFDDENNDNDDDGLFAPYWWKFWPTFIWVNLETVLVILLVAFFFLVPEAAQEWVFTKLSFEDPPPAGHSALPADEEDNPKILFVEGVDKNSINTDRAKKPRVYYIDNLRSFLTVVVVTHHVMCAISNDNWSGVNVIGCHKEHATYAECNGKSGRTGLHNFFDEVVGPWALSLNQAYFMALFFFISGLFSPPALKKKGIRAFLKDKLKRLGIPFLVWQLALGPFFYQVFVPLGIMQLDSTLDYNTFNGPPWFILVLLIFNIVYAFAPGTLPTMPLPSIPILISFVGIPIGSVYALFSSTSFTFGVPGGWHSMFSYIVCFAGGLIASKNNWMDDIATYPAKAGRFLYFFTVMISFTWFMNLKVSYDYPSEDYEDSSVWEVIQGIWAVIVSLALMNFFAKNCDLTGPWIQRINDAAYMVYMIHYYFIIFGIWVFTIFGYFGLSGKVGRVCYQAVGEEPDAPIDWEDGCVSTNDVSYSIVHNKFYILMQLDNNTGYSGFYWSGFLFVSFFSLLTVWPVAWVLKQIPGVKGAM